eukprot:CAMPEP_0172177360 /NCGR_PEP_ID=MMETSP1050-20130122/15391_1 /TAXON_ID=233186 /ORGANISM="Cryptomonas curvata, Strain CCAP979/52" /LENGTH=394 /DNA_ID=CAMNT_0012849867 /DNA_START=169 /DNA_END=1353 /DNA_ORIENTATION=-
MNCFQGINIISPAASTRAVFLPSDCEILTEITDSHGFIISGPSSTLNLYTQWESAYSKKQKKRVAKWAKIMKGGQDGRLYRSSELKKLVRKGVPSHLRGKLWMDLSGASAKMASDAGLYQRYVDEAPATCRPDVLSLIEVDLHRTFPHHPNFNPSCLTKCAAEDKFDCQPTETPHLQSLRRVLRAYSARNKLVGYCQGMNFIAGAMLLFLNEESCFWLLATLLEDILPSDYYDRELFGCNIDLMVLQELLPQVAPRTAIILSEAGLGLELLAVEWMVCAFVRSLGSEPALRIWDCLFSEGGKVLFRAALALVRAAEPALLAATASVNGGKGRKEEAVLGWMQTAGKGHIDADRLLKDAFALPLRRRDIEAARERCRDQLAKRAAAARAVAKPAE